MKSTRTCRSGLSLPHFGLSHRSSSSPPPPPPDFPAATAHCQQGEGDRWEKGERGMRDATGDPLTDSDVVSVRAGSRTLLPVCVCPCLHGEAGRQHTIITRGGGLCIGMGSTSHGGLSEKSETTHSVDDSCTCKGERMSGRGEGAGSVMKIAERSADCASPTASSACKPPLTHPLARLLHVQQPHTPP